VSPSSNSKINVISASTEEIYMTVAEAQEADIQRAVSAARTAFDRGQWPRMTPAERAGYLREIGKGIAARWPDVADIWSSEMGIVRSFSGVLGPFVNSIYNYYASLADTFAFEERHAIMQGVGLHVREPVGVVAAIVPWNAPPILTAQKVAPALLAGCTIVLKASPEAPGSIHVLAEIIEEVGLPEGVFNFVTADREVSELLVRHPGIDKVTFTGSIAAGKKIASICGERIARCTLERGGKSAAVILDDYDLATAARSLATSTEHMTGQVCGRSHGSSSRAIGTINSWRLWHPHFRPLRSEILSTHPRRWGRLQCRVSATGLRDISPEVRPKARLWRRAAAGRCVSIAATISSRRSSDMSTTI
jgi:acyl-CoA reductase-like NAD-dependent aldehyde dehydrogenase